MPAPTQKEYLGFGLKAYQSNRIDIEASIKMGGNSYGNAIVFSPWSKAYTASTADFNLNGEYTRIKGKIGYVDGTPDIDAVVNIYGDGNLIKTLDLSTNMYGEDISLNVNGVKQLKI